MEYAKKMVLVPEESIMRMSRTPNDRTIQTPGTTLSRLDEEMSEILNSTKFTNEREKYKAYLQTLQRYLYFIEGARGNMKPPTATDIDRISEEKEEGKEKDL